jgi:hypothetical protein
MTEILKKNSTNKGNKKPSDIGLSAKERIFVHALRSLFDSKDEKGKGKARQTANPGWDENRKGPSVSRTQGKAKAKAMGDVTSENRVHKQIFQTDSKMKERTIHPPFWRAGPGGPNEVRHNALKRIQRTNAKQKQTKRASDEGAEAKASGKVTKKRESKGVKMPKITVKREPEAASGKKWTPSKVKRAEKRVDLTARYRLEIEGRIRPPTKANLRELRFHVLKQRAERNAKVEQKQQLLLTDPLPKGVRGIECVEAWGGPGCLSLLAAVRNFPTKMSYGFKAFVHLGGHPFRDYKKAAKGLTPSHLETGRKQKTRMIHNFRKLERDRKVSVSASIISEENSNVQKRSRNGPKSSKKTNESGQGLKHNSSQMRRLERRREQRVSKVEMEEQAAVLAAKVAAMATAGTTPIGKDRLIEVLSYLDTINMLQRPARHDSRQILQRLENLDESHEWFLGIP